MIDTHPDETVSAAVEQMRFWRDKCRMAPWQMLLAVGVTLEKMPASPSFDDAVWAIARAYAEMGDPGSPSATRWTGGKRFCDWWHERS